MNEKIFCGIDDELLLKMSGAILRKAEIEKDFEKVYTRVFENLVEMEVLGFRDVVEILGNLGG
ncbi:MAG: hypothetical protein QXR09_02825 [Candidatus Aenigmatarchaeota archaeon]